MAVYQGEADWERQLLAWMRLGNELELGRSLDLWAECVRDFAYVQRQENRLARLLAQDRKRGVKRLKNETRLKWLHVRRKGEGVRVLARVRRAFLYRQRTQQYLEERVEHLQCLLVPVSGRWVVRDIRTVEDELETEYEDIPSTPFLHPAVRKPLPRQRRRRYDREAACRYADRWWNDANPEFGQFHVDCTNYVSQCLYAGGVPMDYTERKDKGWWHRRRGGKRDWSLSWSVAHSLHWYLSDPESVFRARIVDDPRELALGDVICYDWDGSGRYGHSTIVTAKDDDNMPLVNAHTANSRRRYWDYRDSTAWTNNTRYRLFHIADRP